MRRGLERRQRLEMNGCTSLVDGGTGIMMSTKCLDGPSHNWEGAWKGLNLYCHGSYEIHVTMPFRFKSIRIE